MTVGRKLDGTANHPACLSIAESTSTLSVILSSPSVPGRVPTLSIEAPTSVASLVETAASQPTTNKGTLTCQRRKAHSTDPNRHPRPGHGSRVTGVGRSPGAGWRGLQEAPRQTGRLERQIVVVVIVIVDDVRGVAVVAQRDRVVPEHSVPVVRRWVNISRQSSTERVGGDGNIYYNLYNTYT